MTASILAVDDSASLRMAIRIALTGAGYSVTEAGDGVEGLAKANAAKSSDLDFWFHGEPPR